MQKKPFQFLLILIAGVTLFCACSGENHSDSVDSSIEQTDRPELTGHQLAVAYCSSCHLFPEPDLLDKQTWEEQTLPAMGPHLGIFEYEGEEYPLDLTDNLPDDFYPDDPEISFEEWQKILDYYLENAPERLMFDTDQPSIRTDNAIFEPRRPGYRTDTYPMASAVKFDPGNGLIYLGDGNVEQILIYDRNLEIVASMETPTPVSHFEFVNDAAEEGRREMIITFIGDISPSDRKDGIIASAWFDPATLSGEIGEVIIDEIRRPVESLLADLDGDGTKDLLVSEFGHRTGSLFWLKGEENGFSTEKRTLIDVPGCIQAHVTDFTRNGHPDVLALCTQEDQTLYLFENSGSGEFSRSTLLQFQVTAGSSSFDLADMNGNGHPDILYTSGDNVDYSITYKPYHGVYLYLNDGNNRFEEEWFYHINGAYNVKARDFTGDGNKDLAVIAFFADYAQRPEEGFVFFQNNGNLDFTPYHPQQASFGRWITMDVADWTGNSRDDIVLANFSMGPTRVHPRIEQVLTQSPHLLVLENMGSVASP